MKRMGIVLVFTNSVPLLTHFLMSEIQDLYL